MASHQSARTVEREIEDAPSVHVALVETRREEDAMLKKLAARSPNASVLELFEQQTDA